MWGTGMWGTFDLGGRCYSKGIAAGMIARPTVACGVAQHTYVQSGNLFSNTVPSGCNTMDACTLPTSAAALPEYRHTAST